MMKIAHGCSSLRHIPHLGEEPAHNVADDEGHHDEADRPREGEGVDRDARGEHVHAEDEIQSTLCHARKDEQGPEQMNKAEKPAKGKAGGMGGEMVHSNFALYTDGKNQIAVPAAGK